MVATATPNEGVTRYRVARIGGDPAACQVEAIRAAIEACDFEDAAVRALARASRGEDVPAELACAILEGVDDRAVAAGLIAIASGDRAAALIDVIRRRRLDLGPTSIEVIALLAARRFGAPVAWVIAEVRRLSRDRHLDVDATATLAILAKQIDDANLTLATSHLARFQVPEAARLVDQLEAMLAWKIDDAIDALPEGGDQRVVSGFTVRTGPQPGRNEPCPCGSGKKYKRCCADKDAAELPSPVAGLTWDRYLSEAARLSNDEVDALTARDLVRVDLGKLADRPLCVAIRRFTELKQWHRAATAIEELARRPTIAAEADDWRELLIVAAIEDGELELARAQQALVVDQAAGVMLNGLALDLIARDAGALDHLERAALAAVADDDALLDVNLAHALLRSSPALGLLVARGCVRAGRAADVAVLLDTIEDARDRMALPPGDPVWDVSDAVDEDAEDGEQADAERARMLAETAALRASLAETSSRLGELSRDLSDKQQELEAARRRDAEPAPAAAQAPAAQVTTPEERDRIKRLAARVDELQGLIREGNAERRELRGQLAAAAVPRDAAAASADETADETAEGDEVEPGHRGVAIPSVSRRAIDAVGVVPASVAAEAMRTIGALAAGDTVAWRGVKQARDMQRAVLMARIGIHHRLLFRIEDGTLSVLDLVTREDLMTRLKRMRAHRE